MERSSRRTLWPLLRLFRLTWPLAVFFLVTTYQYSGSHASQADDRKKIVTVDNRHGNPSAADYTDILLAVNAATDNATIGLQEGVYVVDNPVVLNRTGVRIKGQGREKTIIRPRNAGKAIFKFKANNLSISDLSMDAEIGIGLGRASFGIHIEEGYMGSEVLNTQILNTAASAIIGHSINGVTLNGNIIVNSGDDGIQMRGDRLTVSNNIIFRYYDEAIDLAGSDILVVNNYARSGRIGITIGGGTNIVVDGNIVEQHIHGGFNVSAKRRAIFSHNIVKGSIAEAYQLTGFDVIDSNRAEGNNRIGFKIADMNGGVIRENLALNSGIGFNLVRSNANLVYRNEYLGEGKDAVVFDKHSHENHTLEDRQLMSGDSPSGAARPCVGNGSPRASSVEQITSTAEKRKILESLVGHSLDIDRGRPDHSKFKFHVKGESEGDIKVAKALADFLAPHNPGFLSIDVQGYRFRSQIAPDLGTTLKEAGDLAIGVVRMPIKILRAESRTLFPVWHLSVGEMEVGIVTLSLSGPGARILVTEEGSLNVERRLILFVAHAAHLFRSFYYTGRKLLVGVTVIVVFSTGGWILWRFKKRMAHRKI